MDSLTLEFAILGARTLALGTRGATDLLSVSLSTTDKIGHSYGPDSREMHDHLLRLDRWLGEFIESLGTIVPRQRMLIVLTSDHGMTSFPEYISPTLAQLLGVRPLQPLDGVAISDVISGVASSP